MTEREETRRISTTKPSKENASAGGLTGERHYWLDEPRSVTMIVRALVAICAALFAADALYHKHVGFAIENVFGFYALYGFIVCVGLVLVAKWMRTVLMRAEDYYEPDE